MHDKKTDQINNQKDFRVLLNSRAPQPHKLQKLYNNPPLIKSTRI